MLVAAFHVIRLVCTSPLKSAQASKTLRELFLVMDTTLAYSFFLDGIHSDLLTKALIIYVLVILNAHSLNLGNLSDALGAILVCMASI